MTSMTSRQHRALRLVGGVVAAIAVLVMAGLVLGRGADTPAATPEHRADGTVAAFYGDSYTRGTGASARDKRWSSIVSAERGWVEFNPSLNGLGFVNNRASRPGTDLVDQVIAARPDIVISTMGLNDNFSMPGRADEIQAAISRDFTAMKAALPDARFIVVEPFWYTDERPESVQQIIGWVKAAADAIGADYIPGASHWMDGHPEWKAADDLHPNDDGYRAIAARMDVELHKLGL
jgi:lysophospholipase L1-like esterase